MGAELALGQATLGPPPWELLKSGSWPAPEELWPEPRRWDAVYKSRPLSPRSLAVLHDFAGHKVRHCQPSSDASDLDEFHQEPERLSEPEPQPGPAEVEATKLWRPVADHQLEEAETAVREATLQRLETEVRLLNTEIQDLQQEGTQLRLRAQTAEAKVSALMQENQALVEQLRPKH
mmetsp:Transcript_1492/g.3544  ORF Transcript_1492/g.3544 Transcript_1492/m.3544 type:complete len:177 (-) Transcript_1492:103-633(-)